eukprot:6189477-Pleurochrysis_carterae.AAC.3
MLEYAHHALSQRVPCADERFRSRLPACDMRLLTDMADACVRADVKGEHQPQFVIEVKLPERMS